MHVPIVVKVASLRWSNKTSQNQIKSNDIRNNKEGSLWPENNPEIFVSVAIQSHNLHFNLTVV
jgi:hypothetical protein